MVDWNRELERAIRRIAGPEDESDDEVNGDPDSTVGEEDESGFDEMADWTDWQTYRDDGFDDAGAQDDGEEAEDECRESRLGGDYRKTRCSA